MLTVAQVSGVLMTWLALFPVATHPTSCAKDRLLALGTFTSTKFMSPDKSIAKMIDDTSEPCGIDGSPECLMTTFP
jgi:hypothetical protein